MLRYFNFLKPGGRGRGGGEWRGARVTLITSAEWDQSRHAMTFTAVKRNNIEFRQH